LIGDASAGELDPDTPAIRALELLCARAGSKQLCLSVKGVNGMADALAMLAPDAVVLAGSHARDDEVARWAYAVRSSAGALPVTLFRREVIRPLRARTTGARLLPPSPTAAQLQLLELVETDQVARGAALRSGGRIVGARTVKRENGAGIGRRVSADRTTI
jgi:hypothetical protein